MRIKELVKIIRGTNVQKDAAVKKFIGSEIEIHTDIANIDDSKIDVWWFDFKYGTADYDNKIEEDNLSIDITYDKNRFGSQLLSFSIGDRVLITAKLIQAEFSGYSDIYKFELISIRKISRSVERREAEEKTKGKKSEGCFIATACYGNYNSIEVVVLRQFRDERLLKTFFGKAFVKFYYSVSPFLAKLISKSDLLKKSVRQYFLEPIVTRLQQRNKSK